jgi:hypothetical protein
MSKMGYLQISVNENGNICSSISWLKKLRHSLQNEQKAFEENIHPEIKNIKSTFKISFETPKKRMR